MIIRLNGPFSMITICAPGHVTMKINISVLALMLLLPVCLLCQSCGVTRYKSFDEWVIGTRNSIAREIFQGGTLRKAKTEKDAARLQQALSIVQSQPRHRHYRGFKTLELLFNPQGGKTFPPEIILRPVEDESAAHGEAHDINREYEAAVLENRFSRMFMFLDAGLADVIFPYRMFALEKGKTEYFLVWLFKIDAAEYLIGFLVRGIEYPVSDIVKIVQIPFVSVYYLFKNMK